MDTVRKRKGERQKKGEKKAGRAEIWGRRKGEKEKGKHQRWEKRIQAVRETERSKGGRKGVRARGASTQTERHEFGQTRIKGQLRHAK